MSKIAYKPAATGTGVFTIESPATNTDRTLTLPDAGGQMHTSQSVNDHASMPTVGGVPIVESGSNSDGNWTKFEDGLSVQRKSSAVVTSNAGYVDWTYPVPLVESTGAAFTGYTNTSSFDAVYIASFGNPSQTLVPVQVTKFTISTASFVHSEVGVNLMVVGRWK